MSFGFGVGDFVTVLQFANNIRRQFVQAPDQFKAISEDVKALSSVLRDVDDVLALEDLNSQQKNDLDRITQGCCALLNELENTLKKYREIDTKDKSASGKSRRVWKRLQWDQRDIDQFRHRITLNISAFSTFLTRIQSNVSSVTKIDVDRLHGRLDGRELHEEHQAILRWLTPIDYALQQNEIISKRQEGTGTWVLKSNGFQNWINQSGQTLFCQGIPGAGKTMIASIVIDHLRTEFQSDPSIGIIYLYCNYQRQDEQNIEDLVLSLLKQLVQKQSQVPANIQTLYEEHEKKQSRPSFYEIVNLIHSTVGLYSKVFIIVDALDECQFSTSNKLLSEIFEVQALARVNILATSRFVSEIASQFKDCIIEEIRAHDDDVLRYVNQRIPSLLRGNISKYPQVQDMIKKKVVEAADGMFLLVRLHMDSIMSQPTLGHIKRALENLPRGMKGLDEAYELAMKRIEGQEEGYRNIAKQVLSWVIHAKRALSATDLQYALAIDGEKTDLDEDFLPEIEILGSVCAGLVTVDKESGIVRLVHYTTQEYFKRKSSFPNAETDITLACVTYLSFDTFASGLCPTEEEFESRLELNPFYDYASQNWGHHARAATTEVVRPILRLLESEAKVAGCSQVVMDRYYGYKPMRLGQIPGIHLAAHFGLSEVMINLLENEHNPNLEDFWKRTPLSWASGGGHEAVIQLLLADNDVNPNLGDLDGRTSLSWASRYGHDVAVKLLLSDNRIDPDQKDGSGWTPLVWASEYGNDTIVKILLADNRIDPNTEDKKKRTPLIWASSGGHNAVVKLLLANSRVDPNHKDDDGQTPLSWTSKHGHEAVVKILLADSRIDPNQKDDHGQTPLSWASRRGYEAVVKLLLVDNRIDPNHEDNNSQTPLSLASIRRYEPVIKLLLEDSRISANHKDSDGRTPLSWASQHGHEAVVKLLITASSSVDLVSRDFKYNYTPLAWAIYGGHFDIMELLLEKHKENGVAIRKEDLAIGHVTCDICQSTVPNIDAHYHCNTCHEGDFDLCQICVTSGAFCLNPSHRLIKRKCINFEYVEISEKLSI